MTARHNSYLLIILYLGCLVYCEKYHEKDISDDIPKLRNNEENDKHYWISLAESELQETLNVKFNENVAKNVIMFLGDGMGIPTVTAARIYVGQSQGKTGEEGLLSFEKFPHAGLIKTYNVNYQVPDSAGTGTAYLCGVKTNKGVIGVDARVKRGDCNSLNEDSIVYSIAKWSQDKGKRTGVVTSTRITHATPANIYAHVPDRDWECNKYVPKNCDNVKDIARQLIEDEPGKNLNIIMGGGLQAMDGSVMDKPGDPVDDDECLRTDNRTLWKEWLQEKRYKGKTAAFVTDKDSLENVDLNSTEFLMGIFANSHIPYEHEKLSQNLNLPTLSEMTEKAIKLLQKGDNGFFLLVEGGRIDHAHHGSLAKTALDEAAAMDQAILKVLELTNQDDTLIVVTADHSHTMTINGYPKRGNPITGTAGKGIDSLPYTTLSYANGPGFNYTVVDEKAARFNLTETDTSSWSYVQNSAVPKHTETHGGEDVSIYAIGPMAHLFNSVHEQNYVAYAMAYASCVGNTLRECNDEKY